MHSDHCAVHPRNGQKVLLAAVDRLDDAVVAKSASGIASRPASCSPASWRRTEGQVSRLAACRRPRLPVRQALAAAADSLIALQQRQ